MNIDMALQAAEAAKYPILNAPFHGSEIPVMLRELSHIDCLQIGDFSLIDDFHGDIQSKTINVKKIREYVLLQHKIVKAALVKPDYVSLIAAVQQHDNLEKLKSELAELEKKAAELKPGPARSELEDDIAALDIMLHMPLPAEFTGFIEAYALGYDRTDIKKVNEEMLRTAGIMAELGGDNPADHIGGRFERWAGDKLFVEDINKRSRYIRAMDKEAEANNGR
jgi:hypothetical protein